jgi:hypothetical protein
MSLVQHASKGKRMNTLEQLHIQKYHHKHQLITEQNPPENNPYFGYYTTSMHILATREAGPHLTTSLTRIQPAHTSQVYG